MQQGMQAQNGRLKQNHNWLKTFLETLILTVYFIKKSCNLFTVWYDFDRNQLCDSLPDNAEYSSEDPGERARLRLCPRSDVSLAVGARQRDGLDAEAGHLHVLHDHRGLLLGLSGDGVGWQRRIGALLLLHHRPFCHVLRLLVGRWRPHCRGGGTRHRGACRGIHGGSPGECRGWWRWGGMALVALAVSHFSLSPSENGHVDTDISVCNQLLMSLYSKRL